MIERQRKRAFQTTRNSRKAHNKDNLNRGLAQNPN